MHVSMRGPHSVDELIRKLLERRAALMKSAGELLAKSAESLANKGPQE